ncbi:hypothetical protein ACFWAR_04350 [Streptomyces sp. NPDC059917]|uniref:hypothetical protein n=1 Tax=Streptomyces sp. NPDC059917 TaxID=3347002 RepID=UPI003666BA1D
MKLRHARSIAVFLVVLVTLTGGRGSRGGSCDDHARSGSPTHTSSGGSGAADNGDDHDGNQATATPSPASTTTFGEQDVSIDKCELTARSDVLGNVRLTYRITNGNSEGNAKYDITFAVLRTSDKQVLTMPTVSVPILAPGRTSAGTLMETAATRDDDMRSLDAHCIVSRVEKTPA